MLWNLAFDAGEQAAHCLSISRMTSKAKSISASLMVYWFSRLCSSSNNITLSLSSASVRSCFSSNVS